MRSSGLDLAGCFFRINIHLDYKKPTILAPAGCLVNGGRHLIAAAPCFYSQPVVFLHCPMSYPGVDLVDRK